jgi:HEAT repeat protein
MPPFGPPDIAKLKARGDVPGLIEALGRKKDSAVRQDAATTLGHLRDALAAEPLIRRRARETGPLAICAESEK